MSVSEHLEINLAEYDARIRTFIPDYEEMLDVVTHVVQLRQPRMVIDLGTGTGALGSRIAKALRRALLLGIDEDAGMLHTAARRLPRRRTAFLHASFLTAALPECDAITASFALHHVEHARDKRALFRRARQALRRGGVLVSADCHPPASGWLAADARRAWLAHLRRSYDARQSARFLRAWAKEDFYTTLEDEQKMLQAAGFETSIAWRRDFFAVIVAQ